MFDEADATQHKQQIKHTLYNYHIQNRIAYSEKA